MPMIPGDTSVADGTLSGELYAALDGLDSEVAADTFRRALCEAFGIAIATHANETIVEGDATPTAVAAYHFAFANATSDEVFMQWNGSGEQASADTVTCRLPCPYGGRVLSVMMRADNACGSISTRVWRATGTGTASGLTTLISGAVAAGTMRRLPGHASWTFSQDDWIALSLNPSGTWQNLDGLLVVEYDL